MRPAEIEPSRTGRSTGPCGTSHPFMFNTHRTTHLTPRRAGRIRASAAVVIATLAMGAFGLVAGAHPAASADDGAAARVASSAAVALEGITRGDDVQLNLGRHLLAQAVADASGADVVALERTWVESGIPREVVVYTALSQVGVMYRAGGEAPEKGFDCSGLTKYAWSAAGLNLDHNDQTQINEATREDGAAAHAGDLVQWPGHIMLYLGVDDVVVHSSNSGQPVAIFHFGSHIVTYADPLGSQ
jgi:peptidoglycan DL-endopeptidase CwlO